MNDNNSGLCIASMVLGIVGICIFWLGCLGFIPEIIALIFSCVCLATKKQPKWAVITGLVTSIVGLCLSLVYNTILLLLMI